MEESLRKRRIEFDGPATYRIVVQGALPADWSDRLAGMEIADTSEGDDELQVTLLGPILDQSALRGVLDTLYNLHLPIVSIEQIEDQDRPK